MNKNSQFSRLDSAFSQFLFQHSSLDKDKKKEFQCLISKLSSHLTQGHNCISINQAEQLLVLSSGLATKNHSSPLPLIVENGQLYFYRYWFYENRLANQIKELLPPISTETELSTLLNKYFTQDSKEIDWQKAAAKKTITHSFSIITGGPGTGKTTTIVKILAILLEIAETKNLPLLIALAAPTGKAAKRLQESINLSKKTLPCSESIKKRITTTSTTLHHLLAPNHLTPYFKHNAKHPLIYDIVIVDEASMIDLALMSKLVDSLKPRSKFILLGDKDQLASVESGTVLRDLTNALPEHTVELKKSFRFQGQIKEFANAVNSQLSEEAWNILKNDQQQISLLDEENQTEYAIEQYTPYLEQIKKNTEFKTIFSTFNQFQILCATRHGENGVIDINNKIEKRLARQNKIRLIGQWYIGRPILVTQNKPEMQLYNGDIGICLQDEHTSTLAVFFPHPDGNSIKKILPHRLPAHETVFAMSIHKSQGSEFDHCLCILPNAMSPILSKELIYTAITRAKTKLKIQATYSIFNQALQKKIVRTGGLFKKLKNGK